jgi:Helix-turn-helix domain
MNVLLDEPLLSDKEAAAILCVAARTPSQWRLRGKGPRYVKYGKRVFYRRSDILEFIANNVVTPQAA